MRNSLAVHLVMLISFRDEVQDDQYGKLDMSKVSTPMNVVHPSDASYGKLDRVRGVNSEHSENVFCFASSFKCM